METSPRVIFIAGIHTGVGKTIAASVLTEQLQADYWKPVQAGIAPETDSATVKRLVSNQKSYIHPERYCFEEATSPHRIAESRGFEIRLEDFSVPGSKNETLVVESAGGLLSPLSPTLSMLDLALWLSAEIVLVVRHYLGSINHTLLSLELLKAHSNTFRGVLISGERDESVERLFAARRVSILGHIPELSVLNQDAIRRTYLESLPW